MTQCKAEIRLHWLSAGRGVFKAKHVHENGDIIHPLENHWEMIWTQRVHHSGSECSPPLGGCPVHTDPCPTR